MVVTDGQYICYNNHVFTNLLYNNVYCIMEYEFSPPRTWHVHDENKYETNTFRVLQNARTRRLRFAALMEMQIKSKRISCGVAAAAAAAIKRVGHADMCEILCRVKILYRPNRDGRDKRKKIIHKRRRACVCVIVVASTIAQQLPDGEINNNW